MKRERINTEFPSTQANEIVPEHLQNRFYLKPENKNVTTPKKADPNNPHKRLDEYMSVKNSDGTYNILKMERPPLGGYNKSKKISKSNKSRKTKKSKKSNKTKKSKKSRKIQKK
jgi:hypothetical protein